MRNGPGRFDRKTSQWKKGILQGPFYRMPVLCFAAGDYAALLAAEWTALIIRGYFSSYPVFSADPVYFYILIPASFLIFCHTADFMEDKRRCGRWPSAFSMLVCTALVFLLFCCLSLMKQEVHPVFSSGFLDCLVFPFYSFPDVS